MTGKIIGKTFFTADTHFGSERALTLSRRPFDSVEEMDNEMVRRWNNMVGENDTVIHLGDFGDLNARNRLNGKIILIQGNYEEELDPVEVRRALKETDVYITGTEKEHATMALKHNSCLYVLVHRPMDCNRGEDIDRSQIFNLFGHIHGRQFVKKFGIDVGVDCNHFAPITWETVEFYQNAIVKGYYDDNVFC